MKNGTITTAEGRTIGFADYGNTNQTPVLWCHGGPGSKLEPAFVADAAARAGLRLIGIDRPGYGLSTPLPGRTIGGWVSDALAVLDHLGIDRFVAIGASTGGAYALATASRSPRVIAAVACCAVSDMRWEEGKAMTVCNHPVWNAKSRDEGIAIMNELMGPRGEKATPPLGPVLADPPDIELAKTPAFLSLWSAMAQDMFAHGVIGYVDDRLADGGGWGSFDVNNITCPVTVLHGSVDGLVPLATARYTAAIVPGATLRIAEGLGHISILSEVVGAISELLERGAVAR